MQGLSSVLSLPNTSYEGADPVVVWTCAIVDSSPLKGSSTSTSFLVGNYQVLIMLPIVWCVLSRMALACGFCYVIWFMWHP